MAAELAALVLVFDTCNARTTDPADAHSVAAVALCTGDLTVVCRDDGGGEDGAGG